MKILITDGMADGGLEILKGQSDLQVDVRKKTPADELLGIIGDYQCVVIRSATTLTKEVLEKATNMKLIVRAGAGVDNIDVAYATERGIPVMNTASANSMAAAEQTITLMLGMLRNLPKAAQSLHEGRWDRDKLKGYEAYGKTLGVIGLGNIGALVARKGVGLDMKVLGFDPSVRDLSQVSALKGKEEDVRIAESMEEVIKGCDILSLHIPKTEKTKHLMNKDTLAQMRPGSFLVNCARGGVVDEAAVIDALDSEHLRGAAFDVFEKEPADPANPLLKHPKAVCAPHLGASTFEAQARVALTAANQIVGFFKKSDATGVINPQVLEAR